jgi:hypothetical protein
VLSKYAKEIIVDDPQFEEEYKDCQDFKFRCNLPSKWEKKLAEHAD